MGPEYDLLQSLDPFFGTRGAIGFEVIDALIGHNSKVGVILAFLLGLNQGGGDTIRQVDIPTWEIAVRRIGIVRQDIPFQGEPVPMELGVLFASFGKIARLGDDVLYTNESPGSDVET